jgi:hypothetical protein
MTDPTEVTESNDTAQPDAPAVPQPQGLTDRLRRAARRVPTRSRTKPAAPDPDLADESPDPTGDTTETGTTTKARAKADKAKADTAEADTAAPPTEATPSRAQRVRGRLASHVARIEAPPRLRWALVLVVVWHGGLLLNGSFHDTYDAWIHIFLGDHYERDWFSTWDQRWYTGFTTVSYPPGGHMAIAAVSKVTGSLPTAFIVVQLFALLNLTVGVYRFSKIWVSQQAAANAALLLVASSAISETVHLFGQLPTTFSLGFLLNALPFVYRWVFEGRPADLVAGVTCTAATTAGHHVTTLFGSIFFLGPILVWGLLEHSRRPREDEPGVGEPAITPRLLIPLVARRLRRILAPTVRIAIIGPMLLAALVVVVLPYWYWSATDPIVQIAIPHGSRANFLEDRNLGLIFWLIPWGMFLIAIPYALLRATLDGKWPLAASIGLATLLGTGGTTPLPKLLLGPAFDVLTLDRFTFWAAIMILPMAGQMAVSIEKGSIARWIRETGGRKLLASVQVGLVVGLLAFALFAGTLSKFRPFQPDTINTDPIVAFIEKDQHERWRFLTLGFGDQMAWLSAQTTATQVDGNYHSVRRLPELTTTSIERLEGAKYRGIDGLGSLQQFLEVPEKYHLKFIFSNDQFYDPLLYFNGWQRLGPLENGIVVWERADIPPLPAQLPIREVPNYQRIMWGVIPPTMLLLGIFHIVWWAIGRPGISPTHDPVRSTRRLLFGPLRLIDRILGAVAGRLPAVEGERGPRMTQRGLDWAQAHLRRTPTRARRNLRRAVLLGGLGLLAFRTLTATAEPPAEPTATVEAYYDHLDFRRWGDAYALLDPATRPDFELWRTQLSVDGGVLASYAKLDSIEVETLSLDPLSQPTDAAPGTDAPATDPPEQPAPGPREAVVHADIRYLTAIDWYPVEFTHDLVERDGRWYLRADEPDLVVPPDQLVRRPDIEYLIQGRRRVTSANTELTDVQDRPELWISHANLVVDDGLPVIVGEVLNLDVDPADLTITGVLKDENDDIVLRYNATQQIMHRILPRESTPFRIEFQEVAAGTDLDFDPLAFTPAEFDPTTMVTAEVYAKAVVTSDGLDRGTAINNAGIDEVDGEVVLTGELRNDGTQESTIPMLLVSFLDADGEVVWVENYYVDTAVRSQRSRDFAVTLPIEQIRALESADIEVKPFQNGIVTTDDPLPSPPPVITDLPPNMPFESVRIDVSSFSGSQS